MKTAKIALVLGMALICTVPVMAGPHHRGGHHHRHGNDGVRLAAEIIGLVRTAIAPGTTHVIHHRPVVVAPPPRRHGPPRRHHHPLPPPRHRHHHGRR